VSYLLDTNVISELRKGPRADAGVREWMDSVDEEPLFTSVLVLGELRRGLALLRRRDKVAAAALEQWFARFQEGFSDRVLDVDAAITERWGMLNVPDPLPAVDGLLAATALVHDLTLVSRNVRDLQRTGVQVMNPFRG